MLNTTPTPLQLVQEIPEINIIMGTTIYTYSIFQSPPRHLIKATVRNNVAG